MVVMRLKGDNLSEMLGPNIIAFQICLILKNLLSNQCYSKILVNMTIIRKKLEFVLMTS